ncbi:MAG: Hpt domain-containing protein [Pseudomonadota bacterium]
MTETMANDREHIEFDQINGLIAAAGVDGTREIVDAFWRSTIQLGDALAAQVNEGALDAAAKTAHAIKGSAANIGAARLSDSAAMIEIACRENDAAKAAALVAEFQENFDVLKATLDDHLRKSA